MNAKRMVGIALVALQAGFALSASAELLVTYPKEGGLALQRAFRDAAQEIAADLRESAGLDCKVAAGVTDVKAPAICLGAAYAAKAGFDTKDLAWWDNVLAEKDGVIYLFGNDRQQAKDAKSSEWYRCALPSVRAATRLLRKYANVEWPLPGRVGTEVGTVAKFEVPKGTFDLERPPLVYGTGRSETMVYSVANGFFPMGLHKTYGGHSYPPACPSEKYFDSHPEYFGLVGGKRMRHSNHGQQPLCISNPDVQELIYRAIADRFDEGCESVQVCQQDGGIYCECEKCRAMYGTGDDWGEKFWCFHRDLAKRAEKEYPGKVCELFSYAATQTPPKTFTEFPSNVMIQLANYSPEDFARWRKFKPAWGFSVYIYLWGEYKQPGFVAKHTLRFVSETARRFRDENVRGVYRCGYGELFGTEGPEYWVFNRTFFEPERKPLELLDEYCRVAFGPVAPKMLRFYRELDRRIAIFDALETYGYHAKTPLDLHRYAFSPDACEALEEALSGAERLATGKYATRLRLVRKELDYAKSMGRIATLYAAYQAQPTKESLAALGSAMDARTAFLDALYGNGGKNRAIEGWPEVMVFRGNRGNDRRMLGTNGRLGAQIGSPLGWNVKSMLASGVLPGANRKTLEVGDDWGAWTEIGPIQGGEKEIDARFRAKRGEDALEIEMESFLPEGYAMKPFGRDSPVWQAETAETLVAPSPSTDVWYHFIWNPTEKPSVYDAACGLITDTLHPDYGNPDPHWNGAKWTVANSRSGATWRSKIVIPYSDLGVSAPRSGDRWRFNIGRCAVVTDGTKDRHPAALWSPNFENRNISNPAVMGTLIFK